MGLKAMSWLSQLDYQVFTNKKDVDVENFDLTSREKRSVALILLSMPLLLATAGIMVWMKQRV